MKKVICIALILIISTTSIIFAAASSINISVVANQAKITVDGKLITADNFLYNGTTYVPLRAISENLSCNVSWDQQTKTASITSNRNTSSVNNDVSQNVYDAIAITNDYVILKENIEFLKDYSERAYSAYASGNITNEKISDLEFLLSITQDSIKSNNTKYLSSTEKTKSIYDDFVALIFICENNLEKYKYSNRTQNDASLAYKTEFGTWQILNDMLNKHVNPDLRTAIDSGLTLSNDK
jgi:hypothetical protein